MFNKWILRKIWNTVQYVWTQYNFISHWMYGWVHVIHFKVCIKVFCEINKTKWCPYTFFVGYIMRQLASAEKFGRKCLLHNWGKEEHLFGITEGKTTVLLKIWTTYVPNTVPACLVILRTYSDIHCLCIKSILWDVITGMAPYILPVLKGSRLHASLHSGWADHFKKEEWPKCIWVTKWIWIRELGSA